MTRAVTILELVFVMAIVAITMAVATPAFIEAKHSALITKSVSNLHQISLAAMVYQEDWPHSADYGTAAEMGLPDLGQIAKNRLRLPIEAWRSPCVSSRTSPTRLDYTWSPETSQEWIALVTQWRENTLLSSDDHCNLGDLPPLSTWVKRRGLGVTLGGRLLNRFKDGNINTQSWWIDP